MSMPLQGILQTGVSSLKTHQTALAVTSHNIANSNTEGYSRQRAILSSARPLTVTPGQIGLGVEVTAVSRMRQDLLDGNIRLELGQKAKYDTLSQNAQSLEGVFGDPTNTSIGNGLTDFFNSFHDLTTGPEDLSTRQVTIERGIALADFFRDSAGQLDRLTSAQDLTVNSAANDMNSLLDRVAVLNKEISNVEIGGNNANDFRDQRDSLLDSLSQYTDISVSEQPNGMVNVTANGESLVTNTNAFHVQIVSTGSPAHPEIRSSLNGSLSTSGGQLSAFTQSYQSIDQTRSALDGLASTVINEVNNLHTAGYDLNGNQGVAFFSGTDAASIDVSAAVKADPRKVVAAATTSPGNNVIALQMVALQSKAVYPSSSPSSTMNEAIGNLVVQLGSQTQRDQKLADTYSSAVDYLEGQRQSVSGVSMDEELSNMVAYQRGYEAAARIITTVDEMMDTIINHMGRVGL